MSLPARRPAETTGGIAAAATAVAALLGGSTELVAVIGTLAGLLPALVTAVVANGGVRGVIRVIWRGR